MKPMVIDDTTPVLVEKGTFIVLVEVTVWKDVATVDNRIAFVE